MTDRIFAKLDGHCWYCPTSLRPAYQTKDHLIPQSRGGKTDEANLVPCCTNCNKEKSNLSLEEYRMYLAIVERGGPAFTAEQLQWLLKSRALQDFGHREFNFERVARLRREEDERLAANGAAI